MQSRWDGGCKYIHLTSSDNYQHDVRLSFKNLFMICRNLNKNDVIVFHAQSSLPYLIFASIAKKMLNFGGRYVYDIHDLHEYTKTISKDGRAIFRHIVLLVFEAIVFKIKNIKKITVSDGLSTIMRKRYSCEIIDVVYNVSVSELNAKIDFSLKKKNNIVFFGTKERLPIKALKKLSSQNIVVDIYGRGIDDLWIEEVAGVPKEYVNVHGEYNPNDLRFLTNYKASIIFSPDDLSINFRHSLPNKLFQSLNAGHTVLVSENFFEMIQLFNDIKFAVVPVKLENIADVFFDAMNNRQESYSSEVTLKIFSLYQKSKKTYLNITLQP